MSLHDPLLGRETTARLSQLDDLEACVVIYLRLWCAGPEGRCAMRTDLANGLGAARAATATQAFSEMVDILTHHRRRPLHRHALQCACLHPDEGCFAHFVASAASDDREGALWMAMQMVRADLAPQLTAAAGSFGLRIRQMLVQRPETPAYLH
ncbi:MULTISPECIES: hypothetical protein [unclassified Yoonia]|uniref:hypothetical protein n=1 Tax=unclassified Yoonia TaxID=2629118 RepID=UPI002B002CB6|nr:MULTISPECIES: hypothetical protein [unclassified Yoonia]